MSDGSLPATTPMTDSSASDHTTQPTASPGASASRWEDFVDIFYAPSQVFARRENSGFGVPMLVVTALIGIIAVANSGVMQPIMDAEFSRATATTMRNNPQVTAEMMERSRGFGEAIAKYGAFVFIPVGIFFTGLALWLCGKLVDAKEHLNAALMVAAYSFVPRVVEGMLAGVQGLLLDPASLDGRFRLSLGLGRFLDPDTASPLSLALLGRVDLFTIWVTVLLAIGLSVVGRIPRSRAAIAAALVWVAGALPQILTALRS
jgi:hypothetical protein